MKSTPPYSDLSTEAAKPEGAGRAMAQTTGRMTPRPKWLWYAVVGAAVVLVAGVGVMYAHRGDRQQARDGARQSGPQQVTGQASKTGGLHNVPPLPCLP